MSLPLTPERIAAVYECLREFPPFNRWKLPSASDLEFAVLKTPDYHADLTADGEWRRLRVSERANGHFVSIAAVVAHEMVHLKRHVAGDKNWHTHGVGFKRDGRAVCKAFGFDEKTF